MTRDEAYQILTTYLTNPNLIKHCLAAETVMKTLYRRLNPQPYDILAEEKWGITGLLHDADYQLSKGNPEIHGLLICEKQPLIPPDIAYAIKSHNFENTKIEPISLMDWSIYCADQLTGLIVAATLVRPDPPSSETSAGQGKMLATVTSEFILEKFNDNSFAKGANREAIKMCELKLGIPLPEFILITLTAMQSISSTLGL
ncbi:MAG: phosphohydrolase [Candidatus Levybacteria bacterium]|nr:phosphohydrolase [Candidatus Levybacteria bacterium]